MMREAILPRRFLRRLRLSENGLALTEFAFSLPIFITLLFGGLEIINLVMAHMRVNQIAITVADMPDAHDRESTRQIFTKYLPGLRRQELAWILQAMAGWSYLHCNPMAKPAATPAR